MTKKHKAVNYKVSYATAQRLRLISRKSGHSISYLISEFAMIADAIPDGCQKAIFLSELRLDKSMFRCVISPMFVGSFEVASTMPNSEVDKLIHEDLGKKVEQ